MAFGQTSGPPASAKEIARLAELLEQAGFTSFKEARHPYDLSQRQAAGKFTRDEAEALTARLEAEAEVAAAGEGPPGEPEPAVANRSAARRPNGAARAASGRGDQKLRIAGLPDEVLVAELELRGWTCIPPL